jgi:hypothetical protein
MPKIAGWAFLAALLVSGHALAAEASSDCGSVTDPDQRVKCLRDNSLQHSSHHYHYHMHKNPKASPLAS